MSKQQAREGFINEAWGNTVAKLRAHCRRHGVAATGRKAEIIKRLTVCYFGF